MNCAIDPLQNVNGKIKAGKVRTIKLAPTITMTTTPFDKTKRYHHKIRKNDFVINIMDYGLNGYWSETLSPAPPA
jgi:hypothetical protein